jgi:hypothetical protein
MKTANNDLHLIPLKALIERFSYNDINRGLEYDSIAERLTRNNKNV